MRRAIIGGGIIGTAAAFALARDLAGSRAETGEIVLIDAGAAGAGAASFGWLNASFHLGAAHYRLRAESLGAWRRLEEAVPELAIDWSGALCWEDEGAAFDARARELAALGYPFEVLEGADLALRAPVKVLPERAFHFPGEGALELGRAAKVLARAAGAAGVRHLQGISATGLATRAGRIVGVETTAGLVPAEQVLVAAGTGSPALLAPLGLSLAMPPRPGLLVRSAPVAPALDAILVGPFGEVRQDGAGRIHLPVAVGHQGDAAEEVSAPPEELARAALARLDEQLALPRLEAREIALGWRPVPADGLPVIGAWGPEAGGPEGLFVAVMHSGATLAAGVAEGLAREMAGAGEVELFAAFRPGRLAAAGGGGGL